MKEFGVTKVGINVGKAVSYDRGIARYMQEVIRRFGSGDREDVYYLFHYPDKKPFDDGELANTRFVPLLHSDTRGPVVTMINEQIIDPLQQTCLGLDLVWHPNSRGQFFPATRYVATLHDVLPLSQPHLAGYLRGWGRVALYMSRTMSLRRADRIITVSEFSKDEIVTHLGIPSEKVSVVYLGIDTDVFRPDRSPERWNDVRKKYSLPNSYLLTTGSYAPHKNQKTIVDAYCQSELPQYNIGLVMVGPNNATGYRVGYNELVGYVEKVGVQGMVQLLPSVPLEDLITIISNAKMFVTASLYEGFGLTPLEAMACEVPVVASNVAAIPEVCGNAALYADPYDANSFACRFNVLLKDESLRDRMITEGLQQVGKFNWRSTARETLDILASVAEERK